MTDKSPTLSIRAYAAHRKARGLPGKTHPAVIKAIRTGRITAEKDGRIDPGKADAQWARQTDQAQQRGAGSHQAAAETARQTIEAGEMQPVSTAAVRIVQDVLEKGGALDPDDTGEITLVKATLAEKISKVELHQEQLKKIRGETVDRARAVALVFDLARRERDAWIGWPARVSATMAAELGVDAHSLERRLDHHLRAQLAQQADVKLELR